MPLRLSASALARVCAPAFAGIAIAICALPAVVIAAPISAETQKSTYMFGIKCYVANAVSATDPRYNADGSQSDKFKASGQKSYDVIWTMGRAIGNSDDLIQEDIDSYQTMLRDSYLHNDTFFQRVRYECGRVGLM